MNRQFPALRGLAILLVIINHSVTLSLYSGMEFGFRRISGAEKYFLIAWKELGVFAVPVFLFLSGAFVVYAVHGKPLRTGYKVVLGSLKHILWPYLVWSIVFYLLMFFTKGEQVSAAQYLKNLVVGYPFNFVPLLVFFYLLSPLLVWVSKRYAWGTAAFFGLYQLFIINTLKPGVLGFAFPEWAMLLTPPVLRVTLAIWGIFFPLGIIYSQHREQFNALIQKTWPGLLAAAVIFYAMAVLHEASFADLPLAEVFLPIPLILLMPLLRREWIPYARALEQVGKRSYGLYLTNLIMINLILFVLRSALPGVFNYYLLVVPLLFFTALLIPTLLMNAAERFPGQAAYRYVFG